MLTILTYMYNMKRNKYIFAALAGAALMAASCTDFDDYNEAYVGDEGNNSGLTLWQNISGNEQLSDFAKLLERTGYSEKLKASQFYTVWAPLNGTYNYDEIAAHDSTWIMQRFLNSHIANFNYQVTGDVDRRVHTLNEKSFELLGSGSAYTYDGKPMMTINQPNINGTLHTIEGYAEYFPNIYEYIYELDGCDSIASYFKKYEVNELDLDASVEGPIVDGKQTYSDSVIITTNYMAHDMLEALIDDEDSSYTMLIPTDEAFKKAYAAISSAYTYAPTTNYLDLSNLVALDGTVASTDYRSVDVDAAMLTDSLTKLMIAAPTVLSNNDTYNIGVFNNSMPVGIDTLHATTRMKLSNGYEVLSHTVGEPVQASNGQLRLVDTLAYRPWDTYRPEMEYKEVAAAVDATSASSYINLIDQRGALVTRYYNVAPAGTSVEPYVYYYLKNLRAGTYNVYVVFVSGSKPYKYNVQINFADKDGNIVQFGDTHPFSSSTLNTEDTYMTNMLDTCMIGEVTFPVSYAGLGDCAPYLRIHSNRSRFGGDRQNFDNNLKIAGVILRPVEYDEYLKKDE